MGVRAHPSTKKLGGISLRTQRLKSAGRSLRCARSPDAATARVMHRTVKKVTEDIEALKFNTAVSQMMVFVNELTRLEKRPRAALETLVLVLAPFAPHIAEELWRRLGHGGSLARAPWPAFDPAQCVEDTVTLAVQVNVSMGYSCLTMLGTSTSGGIPPAGVLL